MTTGYEAQGVAPENMDQGQGTAGAPAAPAISNEAPPAAPAEPAKAPETPEAPKAPEDKPEGQEAPKPDEAAADEWIKTGDEVADTALDMIRESGVTKEEAGSIFGKAMESGKLEDIDTAALVAKLGQAKANLVLAGIRDWHSRALSANMETVKQIHELVGGEQAWGSLREWANKKAGVDANFAKDLGELRAMVDQGGRAAKAAAKELFDLYKADPTTKGLRQDLMKGDGKPADTAGPLNRAEYAKLVADAYAKNDGAEVARLGARRAAGRKMGL